MSKPNIPAIRRTLPLSQSRLGSDPILVCSICGSPVDPKDLASQVWRECDERDRPLGGDQHVIFLGTGKEHDACRERLNAHPRLYVEETGRPGFFPRLCGACTYRDGFSCEHPDLKTNGGPGLKVGLHDPFANAILCGRNGRIRSVPIALDCAGQELVRAGACGHHGCGVSTAIDDETLTFGWGALDDFGFWEYPCPTCARAWEALHPNTECWPHSEETLARMRMHHAADGTPLHPLSECSKECGVPVEDSKP